MARLEQKVERKQKSLMFNTLIAQWLDVLKSFSKRGKAFIILKREAYVTDVWKSGWWRKYGQQRPEGWHGLLNATIFIKVWIYFSYNTYWQIVRYTTTKKDKQEGKKYYVER